ncbi:MAG TPA: GNAT family N-acetyltransferase [Anaerolineales bacterium]|nr:GNAT family N-acetyltransferase [Anaerolineales bacterium]
MIELSLNEAQAARAIFAPLEHHTMIYALFENNLKARLFVDNASQPTAGMIAYKNRYAFGGDPNQSAFHADILQHFAETELPPRKGRAFLASFTTDAWIPTLQNLFPDDEVIVAPRLYLEITPEQNTPPALPDGFSLHAVTPELLASNIGGMELLEEEIHSERTSPEDFFANGFGICPVYENQIAGWCLSEYNTHDRCEVGIATLEPHQRKGIATTLTKIFLNEAAQRGIRHVGWKCWERNEASVATARKAGFSLVHREQAVIVIYK